MLLGGTARSPDDIKALQEIGLGFAEISIPDTRSFKKDLPHYLDLLDESRFLYLCHGPQEGDPNNIRALENVYFPKLLDVVRLANQVRSRTLTIHLWMDPRFVHEDVILYKTGFLKRLVQASSSYHLHVNIENLSEKANDLLPVFEAVPELGLTLDIGHAQLLTSRNRSFEFMKNCPERIRHVHIHDNNGGMSSDDDLHLPVGKGSIDFFPIFEGLREIGYSGTMTLELRPQEIVSCVDRVVDILKHVSLL